MFKCKNMQNSRSKCYQMQIQGKVCLWLENFAEMPSPEDMKGVKRYVTVIHILPATDFTLKSYLLIH